MLDLSLVYSGKKVFITGGCGFIGHAVATRLVELGALVTVYDCRLSRKNPEINYIEGDVRDLGRLERAMAGQQYVFHTSAILGVEKIIDIPLEVLEINLGGTVHALRAAAAVGAERFLFTSSSEVYGEPRKTPIAEDDLTAPVSTYGVAKLAAEAYCRAFCQEAGLNCTVIRLFNIYGPGQTEKFVMPKFIARVMDNQPPIIFGNGEQSRSYTFITDAVRGILLAAAADDAVGQTFNIGNDQEISLNELARFIINHSGYDLEPTYRPFGDGIRVETREILRRQPDISKARRVLGFRISVPWPEGVARFTESYIQQNKMSRLLSEQH